MLLYMLQTFVTSNMLSAEADKKRTLSKKQIATITNVNLDFFNHSEQTSGALATEVRDPINKKLSDVYDKRPLTYTGTDENLKLTIQLNVTRTDRAEEFFNLYTHLCVQHVVSVEETKGTRFNLESVQKLLREDPLGKKPKRFSDATLWTKNQDYDSEDDDEDNKFLPTEKQRNLTSYHQEMYNYLRGSLNRFMDEPACRRLSLWLVAKEHSLTSEQKKRRLDPDVRVPWADFEKFILTEICIPTLGSYHYIPLHRLKRTDNMPIPDWMQEVRAIVSRVRRHGKGWEHIIDREALHVR